MRAFLLVFVLFVSTVTRSVCQTRSLGKLQEVFAWRQLTYDIDGRLLVRDELSSDNFIDSNDDRYKREIVFEDDDDDSEVDKPWNKPSEGPAFPKKQPPQQSWHNSWMNKPVFTDTETPQQSWQNSWTNNNVLPANSQPTVQQSTNTSSNNQSGSFFIRYNNVPMGVERVGDRVFVTVPRRSYGIPSTLNYIELSQSANMRSPPLKPYPNLRESRSLTSVYRTRADECGRLWMVDTGLLEITNNLQQVQQPAIVIYDLRTNRRLRRYPFKSSDIPSSTTPTDEELVAMPPGIYDPDVGIKECLELPAFLSQCNLIIRGLASITVDITGDCDDAYAYVPDLVTYGLIVYSLRENDSWRHSHNYFHFNPLVGALTYGGLSFQWNDGIFSLTLTSQLGNGCRIAYFHPLISTQEFSVSTCVLKNRTSVNDTNYWTYYSLVGERGEFSQSSMHAYHAASSVMVYADVGRNAVSCWNTGKTLVPSNTAILAQDNRRLNYPSDVHITGDEVWVMANSLPRFMYARLTPDEENFYVYKANIGDLVANTVCANPRLLFY